MFFVYSAVEKCLYNWRFVFLWLIIFSMTIGILYSHIVSVCHYHCSSYDFSRLGYIRNQDAGTITLYTIYFMGRQPRTTRARLFITLYCLPKLISCHCRRTYCWQYNCNIMCATLEPVYRTKYYIIFGPGAETLLDVPGAA